MLMLRVMLMLDVMLHAMLMSLPAIPAGIFQVLTRCVVTNDGPGLLWLPMHHSVYQQGKVVEMWKGW